jgi:hypothetical protein
MWPPIGLSSNLYRRAISIGGASRALGVGTKTALAVSGPGGSAIVNLEGSGKLQLSDLLSHQSLVLPPH